MRLFILILFALLILAAPVDAARKSSYSTPKLQKGYAKKSGGYVAPHYKTTPNRTQRDNYSTKGNTNPYTGKKGTKPLER
ncbi:hypothetical protein BAC1_00058 [uncultured bacterium]|nr:hypothetical protein BAC1_00058 [uncultured bacterium]